MATNGPLLPLTIRTPLMAKQPSRLTEASASLSPIALAAEACYPSAVEESEDGGEIRKVYDLSPQQDPAGIPRSDFEQNGIHYTLTDLLKQDLCQLLLVGVQHSAVKFLLEFLRAGEAHVPILIPGFVAGHGDKRPLASADNT